MERLLVPIHFASGWLGETAASELKAEIADEVDLFWERLVQDVPEPFTGMFHEQKKAMLAEIDSYDWDEMKREAGASGAHLSNSLARDGVVLTDLGPRAALDSILSHLADDERESLQSQYPHGFWTEWPNREYGKLCGFSFMLFLQGLVDDKRTRTKGLTKRQHRFLTHFRDCAHIEAASYCQMFITCDGDAARMAEAVYDYAGASTKVAHIRITSNDH